MQRKTELVSSSMNDLIFGLFESILKVIVRLIDFIHLNLLRILLIVAVGAVAGVLYHLLSPKGYKVSALVVNTEMSSRTIGEIVENYDQAIRNGNYMSKESDLSKIFRVEALNSEGERLSADTSRKNDPFQINLYLSDRSVAKAGLDSVLSYINSNTYINSVKKEKIERMTNRLNFIQSEIDKLDSLKMAYNEFLRKGAGSAMVYNNALNPADAYRQSLLLYDQKDALMEELKLKVSPILRIHQNSLAGKATHLSLTMSIAVFAGLFFVVGVFMMGIYNWNKKNGQSATTE